jgi:hypothetical protein
MNHFSHNGTPVIQMLSWMASEQQRLAAAKLTID